MQQKKYLFAIMMVALWLTGCQVTPYSNQASRDDQLHSDAPLSTIGDDNNPFAAPPKLTSQYKDWNDIFPAFIKKFTKNASAYQGNRVLLISDIQNRSNDYISMSRIKNILEDSMMQQDIFILVDLDAVNEAKQKLGISYDDQLVSRRKMIALAKSVNADYVLFTTIYKAPNQSNDANISLELLYTQTGEILKRVTTAQLIAEQKATESLQLMPFQPRETDLTPIQLVPNIDDFNGARQ